MKEWKIKISGFGGQGVILSGYTLGTAATIYEKQFASMIQSYGPEARGGSCSTQVIINDREVSYPLVDKPEILVAMSQEGYDKNANHVTEQGKIFYDQDLVNPFTPKHQVFQYPIPATRIAEELGKKIIANMVILGYMLGKTRILSTRSFEQAIGRVAPKKFVPLNIKAFHSGYEYKDKEK